MLRRDPRFGGVDAHAGRANSPLWRSFPSRIRAPRDLNEIVESALLLFEGRIQSIRVEKHLDPSLPPVMADPEALRRALANLIDNAAEAMQESLLRVLSIQTSAGERRGMAEIIVADTGPGMTDEMRERLFLPWFSTRAARHRAGPLHRREDRAGSRRVHSRRK